MWTETDSIHIITLCFINTWFQLECFVSLIKKYEFCLALSVEESIALNYLQQSLMHAGPKMHLPLMKI